MKLFDFPILADENIHSEVIGFLKAENLDIISVHESGLTGKTDNEILQYAVANGRVVLTHDSDFGRLSLFESKAFLGIIYLRPGHISPRFTIETIQAIQKETVEIQPPFIVVAERKLENIKIRIRQV